MDIGALGYLSIAAHGHADALAVTLNKDGEEIISDPGTGSYHGHPDWRAVMRKHGRIRRSALTARISQWQADRSCGPNTRR